MEQFLRTVRKSGTSFAVNIPPEIVKMLSIREGDIARITIEKVKNER
ncbi:hypothetical protein HY638_04115 [Candidatus Woesearchaeota archaeon]|nr:hypothetical protein [Candidatus Woesearchaeota archaeon]